MAASLVRSLPLAASPDAAQAAGTEVLRRYDAESTDPEAGLPGHLYDAADSAAADVPVPADAARLFATAAHDLRDAWSRGDATSDPLARLAIAACDLADPFLTTPTQGDEIDGARARFSDAVDPATLQAMLPASASGSDPLAAARTLAHASAALRAQVEQAAAAGDDAAIARLQRDRLGAALGAATAVAQAMLQPAAVPAGVTPSLQAIGAWPNPAVGPVRLAFALPHAGRATLEVVDVTGRRVLNRELGLRPAGSQAIVLDGATMGALPAGVYLVRLTSGEVQRTGRITRLGR